MGSSRETKILNIVCALLVLLAGAVRLWLQPFGKFGYNSLILLFFTAAILIWVCQLRRRLVQSHVRRNLMWAASLMIFWMALRTLKYEFLFPKEHFASRYAWYLFYIPLVFIPLFMFLSVLYIGKPYNHPISHWWKLLYIPAGFLVLGVLTNDLHQKAFGFPEGIANWCNCDYTYGPVYYGVVAWVAVLFFAMMAVVFARSAVPDSRKKIWIPALPFLIGMVYTILYILYPVNLFKQMLQLPEMGCFLFAAFMEALIIAHLLPSNDSYSDFWNASSIGAGIMDEEGVIHYQSQHSIVAEEEQVREAEQQAVLLDGGSVALKSHRIQGGFCYWTKNMSEINHLSQILADLGNVLTEENAILEAENRMKAEQTKIRQQNALYDSIARKVSPQLSEISRLLDAPVPDETAFTDIMKYACILNCYVKRCSNLLLLSHQNDRIDSGELFLAISESIEYVRLFGIKAHASCKGERKLSGEKILLVYELFEAVLESAIPGTDALFVNMDIQDNVLSFQMEINAPGKNLSENVMYEQIAAFGGRLTIETEAGTEYVSLILPVGGDKI